MKAHARSWIGGHWVDAATRGTTVNPADGTEVATYADASLAQVREAISAARTAFDHGSWAHQPRARATALLQIADELEGRRDALAQIFTAENGKPLRESALEVTAAASECRFYAGLARSTFGRVIELEPEQYSMLAREAAGVAGIIVPWNAPVILLVRSLAPALAAGCTVVVKNAPQTAATSGLVLEALAACPGLPPGVVNSFTESGSAGAEEIVASPQVDVVSYTGSTHVGKLIMAAAAGTLKRLNLELGGSAPCILCEDADLDVAVPALVRAGMIMAGQQCVAASRLIVHESLREESIRRFSATLQALKVGRGDDMATEMGPLIDLANRDRVARLVDAAASQGTVHLAGHRPGGNLARGAFLTPSLIELKDPQAPLVTQEIFGPVLTLTTVSSEREAVERANDSRFGLAASVWSRDLRRAQRVAREVRSGTVWINMHGRLGAEVETGGYKESGIGRLHGVQGLDDFLQTKHTAWELGPVG